MNKLSWAVTAGDQVGDSEDDQPCGDHFIDKDLECHDGDAHRPTPGKNPYWQGERKGAGDKSKTPEKSGKNQPGHERDREQQTPQSEERQQRLEEQGYTPESYGEENVNHFADLMERAYERKTGQKMEWDDKKISDLSEMVNEQVGRGFSKDPSEKGIHDPTAPKGFKGPKGRELSRPDWAHRETEFPREGGGKEHVPSGRGGGEEGGLYQHFKETLKDRLGGGEKRAESSLASQLAWGKILQERVQDQGVDCDDMAEARPCEPGEDPKIGKCNPNTSPERGGQERPPEQRPTGPAGKIDKGYRMSDKIKGPAQEGIGLQPGQDAGREQRMAQHVDFLSQDDGLDSNQTTNLMRNMMGGAEAQPQPDGTSLVGSPAATPQEAKQQNDDYRDTLTKSGWETHSEMGNKSVFKKGNTAVVLEKKNNGNQMKIKNLRPPAAPKKKGLFR